MTLPDTAVVTEACLLPVLQQWLRSSCRVRRGSLSVPEFGWVGRRVDLATLTKSQVATAYELKLRDHRRALHQAARNALSFDRSFVVTNAPFTQASLGIASELGVGVVLISDDTVTVVLRSEARRHDLDLRRKVRQAIRQQAARLSDDVR
jgi:hypothetical protein